MKVALMCKEKMRNKNMGFYFISSIAMDIATGVEVNETHDLDSQHTSSFSKKGSYKSHPPAHKHQSLLLTISFELQ